MRREFVYNKQQDMQPQQKQKQEGWKEMLRKLQENAPPRKWLALSMAVCLCLFGVYGLLRRPQAAVSQGEPVYLRVEPGMNTAQVAALLEANRIVDSAETFRLRAKFSGLSQSLKAGNYVFVTGMPYSEVIAILTSGKSVDFRITIPEGYTVKQIAALLEEKKLAKAAEIEAEAKRFAPYAYMGSNVAQDYAAEGFLFPDTYYIGEGQSAAEILAAMAGQFDAQFTAEMRARAAELGLSVREVVTLASLVEREALFDDERPVIAQVFLNRLRDSMPLQSCATVQYILGEPKAELTVADTKIASPYNTYLHMGLPPGPIANPGLASLRAVLYAAPTEYLYFVADKHGRHHFSKTYEEHLRAIDEV